MTTGDKAVVICTWRVGWVPIRDIEVALLHLGLTQATSNKIVRAMIVSPDEAPWHRGCAPVCFVNCTATFRLLKRLVDRESRRWIKKRRQRVRAGRAIA